MATTFSFGFSGDDIEIDPNEVQQEANAPAEQPAEADDGPPPAPARSHSVEELLSTLPSKISYSIIEIESPLGRKIRLPRRELFDIRLQLMAEDDNGPETAEALAGLDNSDIRTNVYEGGFKSWECSIDLVRLLLDRGPRKDLDDLARVDHVIEMGCGTALPTLTLFHHLLLNPTLNPTALTLTDYNASVLRLVTLPNLLLTYALAMQQGTSSSSSTSTDPTAGESGDLDITPDLTSSFLTHLSTNHITLTLLSGSWAPPEPFLAHLPALDPSQSLLLLASETIYSPASLRSFTAAMAAVLGRVRAGKALVAAKRVYFGVGGGVDAFKEAVAERGGVVAELDEAAWAAAGDAGSAAAGGGGVRRAVCEVQMA